MTKKEAIDVLNELVESYIVDSFEKSAIEIAIRELELSYDFNEARNLAKEIDNVTWYTFTPKSMSEGASNRHSAWYRARDILDITNKYFQYE